MEYELKVIKNRKTVTKTWDGKDGLNACARYADAHRGETVIAWRAIQTGVFTGGVIHD